MALPSMFKINLELLPIKFHFFLLFSALSGVLPYLPLVAKQAGISATAVGIIYAVIPFIITVTKPLFGIIVDRTQRMVVILEVLILAFLVSYTVTNYIPAISKSEDSAIKLICNHDQFFLAISGACKDTGNPICAANYSRCNDVSTNTLSCQSVEGNFTSRILKVSSTGNETEPRVNDTDSDRCEFIELQDCSLSCRNNVCDEFSVYKTTQFWLFLILLVIGGVCSDVTITLSDAACYEILQSRPDYYGKQRVWGTIGWGAFAVFIGHLVDIVSSGSKTTDYSPAFYVMIAGMVLDFSVVWKLRVSTQKKSPDLLKDLGKVLSDLRSDVYIIAVFIVGALTALQWNYSFWYIEDTGASKLLLGLVLMMECLVTEAPLMFFAGWIIDKIGHEITLTLALAAFGLRFISTSYITNPWYFLIIAPCNGLTYGLFYAGMTSFAKEAAPPGTEASLQCILGGSFSGLGIAVGSLLCGMAYDKIGGKLTFRYAGILSAIACVVLASVHIYIRRRIRKLEDYERDKNVRKFSAKWIDLGAR